MVGQYLPQTNEKYYSVRCDFSHPFSLHLNTAFFSFCSSCSWASLFFFWKRAASAESAVFGVLLRAGFLASTVRERPSASGRIPGRPILPSRHHARPCLANGTVQRTSILCTNSTVETNFLILACCGEHEVVGPAWQFSCSPETRVVGPRGLTRWPGSRGFLSGLTGLRRSFLLFFLNVEIRGSTLTGPAVQCAVTYAYPTLRYAVCSSGTYPPKRTTASLNNSIEVYLKKLFQIKIIPSRKHHL